MSLETDDAPKTVRVIEMSEPASVVVQNDAATDDEDVLTLMIEYYDESIDLFKALLSNPLPATSHLEMTRTMIAYMEEKRRLVHVRALATVDSMSQT